jgi:hypothetical protein
VSYQRFIEWRHPLFYLCVPTYGSVSAPAQASAISTPLHYMSAIRVEYTQIKFLRRLQPGGRLLWAGLIAFAQAGVLPKGMNLPANEMIGAVD